MIPICKEFEEKLIKHIWRTRTVSHRPSPSISSSAILRDDVSSARGSQVAFNEKAADTKVEEDKSEKEESQPTAQKRAWWSWKLQPRASTQASGDAEKGNKRKERKLVMIGPVYAGLGAGLAACSFPSSDLVANDHSMTRFDRFHVLRCFCSAQRIRTRP